MPWKSKVDPKTGRTYYYNTESKKTQWTKPDGFDEQSAVSSPTTAKPAEQPSAATVEAQPAEAAADSNASTEPTAMTATEPATVSTAEPTTSDHTQQETPTETAAHQEENDVQENSAAPDETATSATTAVAAMPQKTSNPDHTTYEDLVQQLISAATGTFPYRNGMLTLSDDTLMQMVSPTPQQLGKTSGQTDVAPTKHPSHTLLNIQRRLSEEYRSKLQLVRDQYEDSIKSLNIEHAGMMEAAKDHHVDTMRELHEKYDNRTAMDAKSTVAIKTSKHSMSTEEIEKLQQQLMEETDPERKLSATAVRLLTFWKSKYGTSCRGLEVKREQLLAARTKLEELRESSSSTPQQLSKIATALREREVRERHAAAALKKQYLQEAARLGVRPVEPSVAKDRIAQVQLSNASLINNATADGQKGAADVSPMETPRSSTMGTPAGSMTPRQGVESSAVESQKIPPFTTITNRVPMLAHKFEQLNAKRFQIQSLHGALDEATGVVNRLQEEYEAQQTSYCAAVGTVSTPAAQLLEEIVTLRAHLEDKEVTEYVTHCTDATKLAEVSANISNKTLELERLRCEMREREEDYRRNIREKNIDLARVARKVEHGHAISEEDFTDAPTTNINFRLAVLRSRLAVIDSERHILRSEITANEAASDVMQGKVNTALAIPSKH